VVVSELFQKNLSLMMHNGELCSTCLMVKGGLGADGDNRRPPMEPGISAQTFAHDLLILPNLGSMTMVEWSPAALTDWPRTSETLTHLVASSDLQLSVER
jgi:hypothetical protein